ncbi:hypothetical protein [Mycobacteroides abscessus]|uniref:hypothetical protein n=1 Tax=Mycobacteroides abscessus TaxID=36809 RepID=UPI002104ED85|nr:hypothetical protein [Mycobacteroides abscessus]
MAETKMPDGTTLLTFTNPLVHATAVVCIAENGTLKLREKLAVRVPQLILHFEALNIAGNDRARTCAVYAPCAPESGAIVMPVPTTRGTRTVGYAPLIVNPPDPEDADTAVVLELLHLAAQRSFTFAAIKDLMVERLTHEIEAARRNLTAQEIALARLETSQPNMELRR